MTLEHSVSYSECLNDSPIFRYNLGTSFKKITDFHEAINDISDSFSQTIKSGVTFSCHYQTFCAKIANVKGLYKEEAKFEREIGRAVEVLLDFKEQFSALMEGFHLIQREFRVFSETFKQLDQCRKQWQKLGEGLDVAVQRSAAVARVRPAEGQEADKACAAVRVEYRQSSVRYMSAMESWDVGRQSRLLRVCAAVAGTERNLYRQCEAVLGRSELWEQAVRAEIGRLEAGERRASVAECATAPASAAGGATEGYLYRSGRKSWQKWQRRWFRVQDNRLLWCKRGDTALAVLEPDLRICTAREAADAERRFCFELIAPERSLLLQAESEERMRHWVAVFRAGMSSQMGTLPHAAPPPATVATAACSNGARATDHKPALLEALLRVPGNERCADCGDAKPRWASCSLGVTLCTECSGAHRSLGVHVSKVRSLTLDNWEPEMLAVMFLLGNAAANLVYESAAPGAARRPTPDTDMGERRAWAQAKWQERRFVQGDLGVLLARVEARGGAGEEEEQEAPGDLTPAAVLARGLRLHRLPVMALALAAGADPNAACGPDGLPPLHLAAAADSWPACELLVLNGAKIDAADRRRSQTALHVASRCENVIVVWLLLKRGARQNILDEDGRDAYQVALRTANANTVTLLRLQTLNENTKEANLGSAGDETVNDVFRDFTERAFGQLQAWFLPGGAPRSGAGFQRLCSSRSLSCAAAPASEP